MPMRFTVVKNDFARIASELEPAAQEIVDSTGQKIYEGARSRSIARLKRAWSVRHPQPFRAVAGITDNRRWFWASFVEFGTRFQGPQPMLTPAAEAERPRFLARLSRIFGSH